MPNAMLTRTRGAAAALLLGLTAARAQDSARKPLTYETLYGEARVNFDGSYARGLEWLDDQAAYLQRDEGVLTRVDAESGVAQPAYDVAAFEAALRAQGDFDEQAAARFAKRPTQWNAARDVALIAHDGRLYIYRVGERAVRKIADAIAGDAADDEGDERGPPRGRRREITLGSRGRYVFCVRDNDLHSIDTRNGRERRLTRDGSATTLNGVLDWVYQEEIYGRGNWRGYWVREDEEYVAFLQLDESRVPLYSIIDQDPTHPELEQANYPKSGDPNPGVRVGIVGAGGGFVKWADLSAYEGMDILVMRVSWAPSGRVILSVQDREQRWMELLEADPRSGRTRVLLREDSPAWVDDIAHPHWLGDGTFLWLSDRDGYRHIYHYALNDAQPGADASARSDARGGAARLIGRVTRGDWTVRELHGADEAAGLVYFEATCDTDVERHAYRAPLEGGRPQRLTELGATHRADFDRSFRYFIDTFSDIATPPRVYLRRIDGSVLRVISENKVAALDEYRLGTPEFVRVPARDGFELNAMVLRPPDFDPARKHPVWCYVYAGPASATVRNAWNSRQMMFFHLLASEGYVVWYCDPRSACGRAPWTAWQAYARLGQTEIDDIEDGVRWLIGQGYVDPARIGISGHSYGGYMTSYALTHSELFKLGIAGAPVTDWRNYDTIYTERYMRTPQNNPDGYERGSVVAAAGDLRGRLLLIHGMLDDNVHFQNAAQLINALHKAGKQFDLMIYPRDRHGINRGGEHYRALTWKYIRENL